MILDSHVAREGHAVRENHAAADLAIVGNVGGGHHEVAVSKAGDATSTRGSDVQGGKLTNLIVVAEEQLGRLALVFHVLGDGPKRCKLEDAIAGTDGRATFNHRMGTDGRLGTNSDPGADHRKGADLYGRI